MISLVLILTSSGLSLYQKRLIYFNDYVDDDNIKQFYQQISELRLIENEHNVLNINEVFYYYICQKGCIIVIATYKQATDIDNIFIYLDNVFVKFNILFNIELNESIIIRKTDDIDHFFYGYVGIWDKFAGENIISEYFAEQIEFNALDKDKHNCKPIVHDLLIETDNHEIAITEEYLPYHDTITLTGDIYNKYYLQEDCSIEQLELYVIRLDKIFEQETIQHEIDFENNANYLLDCIIIEEMFPAIKEQKIFEDFLDEIYDEVIVDYSKDILIEQHAEERMIDEICIDIYFQTTRELIAKQFGIEKDIGWVVSTVWHEVFCDTIKYEVVELLKIREEEFRLKPILLAKDAKKRLEELRANLAEEVAKIHVIWKEKKIQKVLLAEECQKLITQKVKENDSNIYNDNNSICVPPPSSSRSTSIVIQEEFLSNDIYPSQPSKSDINDHNPNNIKSFSHSSDSCPNTILTTTTITTTTSSNNNNSATTSNNNNSATSNTTTASQQSISSQSSSRINGHRNARLIRTVGAPKIHSSIENSSNSTTSTSTTSTTKTNTNNTTNNTPTTTNNNTAIVNDMVHYNIEHASIYPTSLTTQNSNRCKLVVITPLDVYTHIPSNSSILLPPLSSKHTVNDFILCHHSPIHSKVIDRKSRDISNSSMKDVTIDNVQSDTMIDDKFGWKINPRGNRKSSIFY